MKTYGDGVAGDTSFVRGRFEAHFDDMDSAKAAARDARAVGFVVDVQEDTTRWLAIARRQLAFPPDERDRYASRFQAIATHHGGAFSRFVEELPETLAANGAEPSAREPK